MGGTPISDPTLIEHLDRARVKTAGPRADEHVSCAASEVAQMVKGAVRRGTAMGADDRNYDQAMAAGLRATIATYVIGSPAIVRRWRNGSCTRISPPSGRASKPAR